MFFSMATLVHVTHEAVQQAGGIGTVLRGLITARSYQAIASARSCSAP